mmetsp:Transcript_13555/g.27076  ORF Transcript_13555/g.27076 Transcript_13555/m.27076 type:complete len:211 (+) Transcript_13555:267-899(+)
MTNKQMPATTVLHSSQREPAGGRALRPSTMQPSCTYSTERVPFKQILPACVAAPCKPTMQKRCPSRAPCPAAAAPLFSASNAPSRRRVGSSCAHAAQRLAAWTEQQPLPSCKGLAVLLLDARHEGPELVEVDDAVALQVGRPHHRRRLLFRQLHPEPLQHLAHVGRVDEPRPVHVQRIKRRPQLLRQIRPARQELVGRRALIGRQVVVRV